MYDSEMRYTNEHLPKMSDEPAPINLNFSILQDYFECAYRFKLSMFYGFVQPIVPALGYGKAMHEIVQNIHRKYLAGRNLLKMIFTQLWIQASICRMQIRNWKQI